MTSWDQVKSWRKQARQMIISARVALPPTLRQGMTAALMERLHPLLKEAAAPISFYWPFRGEPDLRPLMRVLAGEGIELALPVGSRLGEPLTFRPWEPGCAMTRGIWDIPIPATDIEILPRTILAPLVGFDGELYRLGYGGGFFDRTLAAMREPADVIGLGYAMFQLPSIRPQPHDIAMDRILTERSSALALGGSGASPVCYAGEMDPAYAGDLGPEELALALAPLEAGLPPERKPLLDFIGWRLGMHFPETPAAAPRDVDSHLGAIIPRVRDDGLHYALKALRAALVP
ncbi:5,10-methenyltetrahydrofolate synthetase [Dongia mobilis]|uniref:5-formyltetrahydrofolate cyclo-ligase n=1 Tax=Dongia mobilis TaxID=578943 RepID=A0A4R6WVP7_9PROT|nr:5-formyltetrahydrofolate cyclo-ligase [Dongia mobilis]TDQ84519.1 5,10-methenyltetrahydrofolate synthetase [Dongia mobilis]